MSRRPNKRLLKDAAEALRRTYRHLSEAERHADVADQLERRLRREGKLAEAKVEEPQPPRRVEVDQRDDGDGEVVDAEIVE
jgi:hypothetical protein